MDRMLEGRRILLVEDDYFVAQECAAELRAAGASVLGPVSGIAAARKCAAESAPDCAVVDINLKGDFAFGLTEEMMAAGIPAVFVSGYDPSVVPGRLTQVAFMTKPVDFRLLVSTIRATTRRPSTSARG